jgi:hypothetical protein
MIASSRTRRARVGIYFGVLFAASVGACVSSRPFDQLLSERRWSEAATAFAADSALMNDESALYAAGVLFGSPSRPTYDPDRASRLLRRLLARFPDTRYKADADDRLALVTEALAARADVARTRELEARIAELSAQQLRLRVQLDSLTAVSDAQRRAATKLEADLRERDEQLRALRLELRQLKEIDLKPHFRKSTP